MVKNIHSNELLKSDVLNNDKNLKLFTKIKDEINNKLNKNKEFIKYRNTYSIYYDLQDIKDNDLQDIEDLIIKDFEEKNIIINFMFDIPFFKKHNEIRYEIIVNNMSNDLIIKYHFSEKHNSFNIVLEDIIKTILKEQTQVNKLDDWIKFDLYKYKKDNYNFDNLINQIIIQLESMGHEAYCVPDENLYIFFK